MSDIKEPPQNNVINISPLIYAKKHQGCNCTNRIFEVDEVNRMITCQKCGQVIEPFDVVVDLLSGNKRYDAYLENRAERAKELHEWFHKYRMPIALKEFASQIRQNLLPRCPHCNEMIDISKITCWAHEKFLK